MVEPGGDDLADHVLPRDTDDESVLGNIELCLILGDQLLPKVVVCLSLTAAPELHLEPLEVSPSLDDADEDHLSTTRGEKAVGIKWAAIYFYFLFLEPPRPDCLAAMSPTFCPGTAVLPLVEEKPMC